MGQTQKSLKRSVDSLENGYEPYDEESTDVETKSESETESKSYEIIEETLQPGKKVDSTCSICEEHAWQIVLECGHPMCSVCLKKILSKKPEKQLCPFDRKEIKKKAVVPIYV